MKKILLSVFALGLLVPNVAHADKFLGYWWYPSHWIDQDFKPYYQDGQRPQTTQWSTEKWEPADWVTASGGNGNALIQRFYDTRIIKEQCLDDGVPVLKVGTSFYHLGGFDKERVMATVDHVYQVSKKQPGMFYVRDGITDKDIGYYTPSAGLILQ